MVQTEGTKSKEVTIDSDLLTVLIKAVLRVNQQSRAMAACLWTTCIVPLSWAAVQEGRKEAKIYAKHIEEKGKKHGLGPPKEKAAEKDMSDEIPVWLSGLEAAAMGKMNGMATANEIATQMPFFRTKEAFSAKLEEMATHLMTACIQAGGERKIGQLERLLEKHLRRGK